MGSLRYVVALAAPIALLAAGCGSSGGSSGSGVQKVGSLVAKVGHSTAEVQGKQVVATAQVKEGGRPGERLSLRWGLVDAVSGVRASEEEKLAATYVTTPTIKKETATIRFKLPTPTEYIVHFALYAPDGSWLSSSDTSVFIVP